MKQKIPTGVGTIIIIIIAVTVGAFLWLYEKNQPSFAQSNITHYSAVNSKKIQLISSATQPDVQQLPLTENKQATPSIVAYKSDNLGITFKYPKTVDGEKVQIKEEDNKIAISTPSSNASYDISSFNFPIKKGEKVTDAIIRIFSSGKNCTVVKKDISGGPFNEIPYDNKNPNGAYDLYDKLGLDDDPSTGCNNMTAGVENYIYNNAYQNKIIFVDYGEVNILDGNYDPNGTAFINWLKSIRYYK